MADITKVKLGTCSVTFNGTDLGHTKGPVEVTYEPEFSEVSVDAYGNTPADAYLKGERLTAKVPLAEETIANLKVAIPMATFAGAANARITIGQKAGQTKMSTLAAQLVLHPINENTRVNDLVIHKAVIMSPIALVHSIEDVRVYEVVFTALVDESKSQGNYLGLIGDSTA